MYISVRKEGKKGRRASFLKYIGMELLIPHTSSDKPVTQMIILNNKFHDLF